jgi:aminoglycoside/choline kinase family phosphotransferase
MTDRERQIARFLAAQGWAGAARRRIAGDASFRKYDRLDRGGERAILMDAPPPHEDVRPWMRIARHLHGLGFSVPAIVAADVEAGLLLIEDLGDDTYTRLLAAGADEERLYALAVDTLIALHRVPADRVIPEGVIPYGMARLLEEVNRLHVWYLPLAGAPALSTTAVADYEAIWRALLPAAWDVPTSLVLFDYHVDNLLGLFARPGIKACGLLDFQDAVSGPVTYDPLSLLEDARRDLDPGLVARMKQRYRAAFPALGEAFDLSWAVMAAQRHTRVLGTFARLKLRDAKPQYLQHVPRLWRHMDACLVHPRLAPLKDWFARHVPESARSVGASAP